MNNALKWGLDVGTYDQFSGGRVILGAGVGWLEEEFRALATLPFADRGAVTDEYLEVFKRVAGGGKVSFEGKHYKLDAVHACPGAVQRPHPPILIGGTSTAALRRVARHGDGWMSTSLSAAQLPDKLARLARLCAEHGRDAAQLRLVQKLFIDLDGARPGAGGKREPGTGSKKQIIEDFKAFVDLGYHEFIVRYRGTDPQVQAEQLKRFIDEIVPEI